MKPRDGVDFGIGCEFDFLSLSVSLSLFFSLCVEGGNWVVL